jgi:hypothetical protein
MGWLVFGVGVLVWILFYFLYGLWSGTWNPMKVVEGADGRASTSKLQFFLWTLVVVYAYVTIYTARLIKGYYLAIDDVPASLLTAMGLSVVTVVAAKGITVGYIDTGRLVKTDASSGQTQPARRCRGLSCVFQDDEGFPDLSKIQMVVWTFIAIAIYLVILVNQAVQILPLRLAEVEAYAKDTGLRGKISLPDISPALMVLMGLGQGAYLGKKLVTVDTPRLTGLVPSGGRPGSEVTISGQALGGTAEIVVVTLNGNPLPEPAAPDPAGQIKFKFPEKQPDGTDWPTGQVSVGVIAGGRESANRLPFTVMKA